MKPNMRNTLFCILILPAIHTLAQSQSTTPRPAVRASGAVSQTVPVVASGMGDGYTYVYSDRQINDADLKSKEVSKEIAMPKNAEIYVENASRGIVFKTWDQQKVKVTTTVYFEGESKLTDDEWLEKVNLSLKTVGSSVKIKSGEVSGGNFYSYGGGALTGSMSNNLAVFNAMGQNIGTKSNLKRLVTITVPAGSKLDIESKYAEVQLPGNIGDVSVHITNGSLEGENINKLILRSKYSNVNIGDVKTAEVEFINGRFIAGNIDDLDIDSKYSSIEMASAKKIVLRSTNDEYELEEAGEVRGRKSYGNLRITHLNNSLEMEGNNADVRIRNVGPALSHIKLDDKFADVRIPLGNTKNYAIDFTGSYSSVYGNFEKKAVTEANVVEEKKMGGTAPESPVTVSGRLIPLRLATVTGSGWSEGNGPSKFTAAVGDGKGLKIEMKCQNCTVDFK